MYVSWYKLIFDYRRLRNNMTITHPMLFMSCYKKYITRNDGIINCSCIVCLYVCMYIGMKYVFRDEVCINNNVMAMVMLNEE